MKLALKYVIVALLSLRKYGNEFQTFNLLIAADEIPYFATIKISSVCTR